MRKVYEIFLICFILLIFSSNVYGYTVDDVRDLVGNERIDEVFTESEINLIVEQYEKIEKANLYVKMFELGKEIDITSNLLKEYNQLEKDVISSKENLAEKFQTGVALDSVLKEKSNLESLMYRVSKLKDLGYEIEVEYIPNVWEDRYYRVQNIVENLNEQYDIGDVGESMRIPLNNAFIITSPFGLRLHPVTLDKVSMHNGLDFSAPENTYIYAQWNGVVSRTYYSESGGNTIEISHGKDLKTLYMHLNEFKVEVGDVVKQYQLIGLSGNTGMSTGPHLHFGVYLDGQYINPVYLYGNKGLQAFKTYISSYPEKNLEIDEISKILKNKPSKLIEEDELIINPESNLILDVSVDNYFNIKSFFENYEKENPIEESEGIDETELKKKEALKKLLNE